ncbi:hypothetical protein TIFTF001_040886 [Ficus carica]|uniref:DUF1985 domain-containing protein n=1 Tax=Ficus carica TaxID=3494 RepID=A0AA87ZHF2_FICCA|nr:hypothetical protein TIFTF001_040848 [Ficus carica]GMN26426.1 hypothetical protein TIFTF001_040854 [Ficus carica]GMN26627.1 hypothetical protein TIFTF001_040880 [Ficus carica]GMN26640.1 hypothetical protein TIFTF001_040886 [Ficus carica]
MHLMDHSGMGDALWFEVGEVLGRFSINKFCLITSTKCVGSTYLVPAVDNRFMSRYFSTLRAMSREHLEVQMLNAKFDNDDDAVKLGLLYMIFCIPLANANSVKIDLKYFALADNLNEFNAFPWGVLSRKATRTAICNAIDNKLSSKRIPLKKSDKMHYSITGFLHALLIWAYESIPKIARKFTTKHVEANPRMLSWTSADNIKFDAVMSALTTIDKKHAPRKTLVTQCSTATNSDWLEFQKVIQGEVESINKKLDKLKKEQKKFRKLLRRVLKLLYNLNDNVVGNPTIAYHEYKDEEKEDEEEDDDEEENEDDKRENDEEDEDEEGDEEKKVEEDEDDPWKMKMKREMKRKKLKKMKMTREKTIGDEGEAKENEEKKYENGKGKEEEKKVEAVKEKEKEKKDEEAKGENDERNDEEAAIEQDKDERKNEEAAKEQEENIND